MIGSVADIGRIMEERGILVMSIRQPSERTKGKWQVSFRETESQLEWQCGKQKPDFISALESALGEKVGIEKKCSGDLEDLLT